ncbi:MAG: glucose-6-phosphate dehydrogenase [Spirochaetaceae bacterium]|nr:MAG: glucose-6-phosphate dehydrogenase [Spirochaetaceae bacterium]
MDKNPLMQGLEIHKSPPPFTLVIFGATGDLTKRKLVPALFALFSKGYIHDFSIIGFARRPWTDESFREEARKMIADIRIPEHTLALTDAFLKKLSYISSDFSSPDGYASLKKKLSPTGVSIFYLSTPPEAYTTIVENLGQSGVVVKRNLHHRIIVEKPFGSDLESAKILNAVILKHFDEQQVYRIDHYLGRETVQNILVMRFGNGVYEPIWNSRYVHHVQITMSETIGIKTRGNYYEKSGALKDIVQNHLLQLLCLVAMEPPSDLSPDSVRNEKVKVLRAIRPIEGELVKTEAIFGQYAPGVVDSMAVPGYREEPDVDPDSRTDTYAAIRVFLDTWRWSGVPFFLRTGKRLSRRLTEISVQFKKPPLDLFRGWNSQTQANQLTLRIQPDEGMRFIFNSKIPGFHTYMRPVHMNFAYGQSFGEESPEAYERLLLDVMNSDSTLFTRNDEIEESWRFVTSLHKSKQKFVDPAPTFYAAGSSGPDSAHSLLLPYNTSWRRL